MKAVMVPLQAVAALNQPLRANLLVLKHGVEQLGLVQTSGGVGPLKKVRSACGYPEAAESSLITRSRSALI